MVYYVTSQSNVLFDSRVIVGLTSTQITEALDTIINPLSNMKYSDLQFTGPFTNVFLYEQRFTLDFTHEIDIGYSFVDIIQAQFIAGGVFASADQFVVTVVRQEEVFDTTG